MISIVIIIIFAAGGAVAANITGLADIKTDISASVPIMLFAGSAAVFTISYLISNAVYRKKEF